MSSLHFASACVLALGIAAGTGTVASAEPAEEPRLPEMLDRALRELMDEVRPALEDALDYMQSFGAIDDPRHYALPEVLPNGDIIIRRRDGAPPYRPDAPEPDRRAPLQIDPDEGVRI